MAAAINAWEIRAPQWNLGASATLEPLSGPVGTRVTVSGTGFTANTSIELTFDGNPTVAFSTLTGVTGNFTATFNVPATSSGSHNVEVSDGTNAVSQNFVVTSEATITPQNGYAGVKISITGSGFLAKGTANVYFDNASEAEAAIGSDGSFGTEFYAPPKIAGTYTIRITDGTNTRELAFAVTTSASVNPITSSAEPGFVGQKITVGGVGFVPGKSLIVNYDAKQIASEIVNADSNFSATFNAPASEGGQHILTVSDGVNVIPLKFFMDSTPPPAPSLLQPAIGTTQDAMAAFKWSAVTDPSGVTYEIQIATDPNFDETSIVVDKTGISSSEYRPSSDEKLKPVKSTNPYFWRVDAEDGASNVGTWSDTSYFTVGVPTPKWVPWMFVGLGAVIIVLFAFWLGRRSSSRPAGRSPAAEQKK